MLKEVLNIYSRRGTLEHSIAVAALGVRHYNGVIKIFFGRIIILLTLLLLTSMIKLL